MTSLPADGVGGLVATRDLIVVSCRDAADLKDQFIGLDPNSGRQLWLYEYDAPGELDYGNSPRATPAFAEGVVVTLGATGVLSALDAASGVPLWSVDLAERFAAPIPTWGFSGSPLVMGGVIYVQVTKDSSLVAIDLFNGMTRWQAAGEKSAYASLMPMDEGKLIVGVDEEGYFARKAADGSLVWSVTPKFSGDFGVPSPVVSKDGLIFASENNGVQWFAASRGEIANRAGPVNDLRIPDTHTPVLVDRQLLVAHDGLHALGIDDGLREIWSVAGSIVTGYASIIASRDRALVTTENGRMLLVDLDDSTTRILDQRRLSNGKVALLSHPAVVDDKILIRVGHEVRCYRLSSPR